MKDKTHMTRDDRNTIKLGIESGKSFREIGDEIGKDPSTISREIKKHRIPERKGVPGRPFNDCRKRFRCPVSGACDDSYCKKERCFGCSRICGETRCGFYEKEECKKLKKPPYVCTSHCGERQRCTLEKMNYSPVTAHDDYRKNLSESRQVLHVGEEELAAMDATLCNGFSKGQSLNSIYAYAGEHMPVTKRTAYNYINNGVFSGAIRLSQPKAVRMKKRSSRKKQSTPSNSRYIGRTYADFILYMEGNSDASVVEMDCVEGKKGGSGKVLLTLLFRMCSLQIAILLDRHDSCHVVAALRALRERIGLDLYKRLFAVILTDRGHEFSDIDGMELSEEGEIISMVFYCDPERPSQKGRCERNHSEIRRILSKGTDIAIGQDKVELMMNNINSMPRPGKMNKCSYDLFVFYYGQDAADALGLVKIEPNDINLTPGLLK